jgi:hypothetical protein
MAAAAVDSGTSINNHSAAAAVVLAACQEDIPWGCGGHGTGGCTVFNICTPGHCGRAERMSCVVAQMRISMHPINLEFALTRVRGRRGRCARAPSRV